jgi:hypothetical protein
LFKVSAYNLIKAQNSTGVKFLVSGSGNVGIGSTSPSRLLTLYDAGTLTYLQLAHSGASGTSRGLELVLNSNEANIINREAGGLFLSTAGGPITFSSAGERARIDSSGRLLVGTSSARANLNNVGQTARFQLEGTSNDTNKLLIVSNFSSATNAVGAGLYLARAGSTAVGSNVVVAAGNQLGEVVFSGSDGTDFVQAALIKAEVDGTPGANDMPGRIVFSTTADGASSPTERMRIDSAGRVGIGTSSPAQKLEIQDGSISIGSSSNVNATNVLVAGYGYILSGTKYGNTSIRSTYSNSTNAASLEFYVASLSTSTAEAMRITSAGLVGIGTSAPASKLEGSISVSGTTVSYNGAHLSRWSQLPSGAERTEILRGSVLSNIDEMCEWGEEDNEQLNRMKVSDVEGDKNVSGVFQAGTMTTTPTPTTSTAR